MIVSGSSQVFRPMAMPHRVGLAHTGLPPGAPCPSVNGSLVGYLARDPQPHGARADTGQRDGVLPSPGCANRQAPSRPSA